MIDSRPKLRIKVADLVVRVREVELPNSCPECQADLSHGKGFNLCYLAYSFYSSRPDGKGEVTFVWSGEDTYIDSSHPCVGVFCGSCGEPIAIPHEKELVALSVEQEQETVFSASLQRHFFSS